MAEEMIYFGLAVLILSALIIGVMTSNAGTDYPNDQRSDRKDTAGVGRDRGNGADQTTR